MRRILPILLLAALPLASHAGAPAALIDVRIDAPVLANGRWEMAVPNGWYVVRVEAADAAPIDVEAVRVSDGAAIAEVLDGQLTVATDGSAIRSVSVCSAYSPDRIVSWLNIGASSPIEAERRVGWNIKKTGWRGYVKRHVEPHLRWGVRRIVVHNPFGTHDKEIMQFDQYLHARRARLRWLTNGFVKAWKPITDRGDVEVICYLGSIGDDPDFDDPARTDPEFGWQPRFWASVQPALSAGMSIGFDASAVRPVGSPTHRAITLLRQRGIKCYIEARPFKGLTHWHDFPVICVDSFWHRSDPARHDDSARWAARNEQLTGEIIRIITAPPQGKTWSQRGWIGTYIRAILADGHSAAVPVDMLIRERVALMDLLERKVHGE